MGGKAVVDAADGEAADPVAAEVAGLASALIRRPSVTPADAGAQDVLATWLEGAGFACTRLPFGGEGRPVIANLFARLGDGGPHFCFAGHTDVVPVGDRAGWTVDPFAGTLADGALWGRGAADMKGAIAAFAVAARRFAERHGGRIPGSISLLITGDEEGAAIDGTVRMLDWMADAGQVPDHCLVGEPTNTAELGDMAKIGRRGSLNATITVRGVQGHVAYPHLADNPVHRLVNLLAALTARPLDDGTPHFPPSSLQLTSIDVGNPATNVIPATATGRLNIRFNDLHTADSLTAHLRAACDAAGGDIALDIAVSGEAFLTPPGALSTLVADAVAAVTGRAPELSTTGGTSDARFIQRLCPVIEFGLVGRTMHKVDERVALADLVALTHIYGRILDRYFADADRPH